MALVSSTVQVNSEVKEVPDTVVQEVNKLDETNKEIRAEYLAVRDKGFTIKDDLIKKAEKLVDDSVDLISKNPDSVKSKAKVAKDSSTLQSWRKSLAECFKDQEVYEKFMIDSSKSLLEMKNTQVTDWPEISKNLQEAEGSWFNFFGGATPSTAAKDNKEYTEKYNNFISQVVKMLATRNLNSIKGSGLGNLESFLKKFEKHIITSPEKEDQKKQMYRDLMAACILREKIKQLKEYIYPNANDKEFKYFSFLLDTSDVQRHLMSNAIDLEREVYNANEITKPLAGVFNKAFLNVANDDYELIGELAKENISDKDVEAIISKRYDVIIGMIEKYNKEEIIHTDALPNHWKTKMEELKNYNIKLLKNIIMTIKVPTVTSAITDDLDKCSAVGDGEHALNMSDKKVTADAVSTWFGFTSPAQGVPNAMLNMIISGTKSVINIPYTLGKKFITLFSTKEWNKVLLKDVQAEDNIRKDALHKQGVILENIESTLNFLPADLIEASKAEQLQNLTNEIKYLASKSRSLIYMVKMQTMKKNINPPVPSVSYVNVALSFIKEMAASKLGEYKALNVSSYKKIEKVSYMAFIARQKQTELVLNYMKQLVAEYNQASKKIAVLVTEKQMQEQNAIAEQLASVNVAADLKPGRSLTLSKALNANMRNAIDVIVLELEKTQAINNRACFCATQKNILLFDHAIQLLDIYTSEKAESAKASMEKYKKHGIQDKIAQMIKDEASNEKSKLAAFRTENIIVNIGVKVPMMLSEAFGVKTQLQAEEALLGGSSDEVPGLNSTSTVVAKGEEKKGMKFNYRKAIVCGAIVLVVCAIIGLGVLYYFKRIKQKDSLLE
ncbi:hypothetical protein NEMIN01_0434 [Nematocida minor]|uniref:uncharacterized protein n=1 Tax=Nematocida minor TaxID=1912983 RepID=UPI00221F165E|nr:uncharacterized protein NEMIN01_0434 [Nematocida minor]KAI5189371.1 hypothetical protein NEMIN01_0434 [Nematocida minor]